jgi:hypothetical protein
MTFSGNGSGTSEEPYQITTVAQLQEMANELSAYYIIMNDIDCGPITFVSVGNDTAPFTGSLDGQGYTLDGLYISAPSTDYQGLIGYAGSGAVITNVILTDVDVTGSNYVGGLVGKNAGTVTNSHATGNVTGSNYAGGLVGNNAGTVTNSHATGNVTGSNYAGGLVGNNAGTVTNSHATGNVTGTDFIVGGLVGYNYSTISNSYATGNVTGGNDYVGGLVGYNHSTISNSYATGNVTGGNYAGGLVGANSGTITSSYYDSETTGQSDTGKGVPLTTAEMQTKSSFVDWSTDIWGFLPDAYPELKVFMDEGILYGFMDLKFYNGGGYQSAILNNKLYNSKAIANQVQVSGSDGVAEWKTLTHAVVSKTAAYTATVDDEIILCDGTFTVTLPAVSGASGTQLNIKNIGTGTITVDCDGSETIDGTATLIIDTQYESYALVCNGINWYII